jgi:hypothetical protein
LAIRAILGANEAIFDERFSLKISRIALFRRNV